MTLYTPTGRLTTVDEARMVDGGFLIPGVSDVTVDGESLFVFTDHATPVYVIESSYPSYAVIGERVSYVISVEDTNEVDKSTNQVLTVPIPSGFNLVYAWADNGTYNPGTEEWTFILGSDYISHLKLILEPLTEGTTNQTVVLDADDTTLSLDCEIVASDPDNLYSVDVDPLTDLDEICTNNLVDKRVYTLTAYSYVNDTGIVGINDGIHNNRLSVLNGVLTVGERVTEESEYTKVEVSFVYDSTEDLIIRLHGQYETISTAGVDEWAGFVLSEQDRYLDDYLPPSNLIEEPAKLLQDDTSPVTIPSGESSAVYSVLVQCPYLADDELIQGLTLDMDCLNISGSQLNNQFITPDGLWSALETTPYTDNTITISIGSSNSLWGVGEDDIHNTTLEMLIVLQNISLASITPAIGHVTINYYKFVDEIGGDYGFTYNGVHSSNYQLFLLEVETPEGPEREFTTVDLPLTDGEVIVEQSVNSKEITLTFVIWADTLQEAEELLHTITTWLTNERNVLGVPIPNTLILDHDPTMAYEAVLSDVIDNTIEYTAIECTATFNIPSGVALATDPTVTGSIGTNVGLTKVRPIITLISTGESEIVLTDTETGQIITINESITAGTVIYVDCEQRTVISRLGTDYTDSVDITSVWFNFFSDYHITCSGGLVQGVSYHEGH